MGRFVPLHDVRSDFALGEFPHTAAKLLLLFSKTEFHGLLGKLLVLAISRQAFAYLMILHERPSRSSSLKAAFSISTMSGMDVSMSQISYWRPLYSYGVGSLH